LAAQTTIDEFEGLDPLGGGYQIEKAVLAEAKKKEIRNIIQSYTGAFDFLSEPLQNALDAIDERRRVEGPGFVGRVWVTIDLHGSAILITDNGAGFTLEQFRSFLRPNVSFKPQNSQTVRGNKGVGATYLAYGFNHLEVATRTPRFSKAVVLKGGREWMEDPDPSCEAPKFAPWAPTDPSFEHVDCGSSFVLKLVGRHIRPSDLRWLHATRAEQWAAILRITTPLGGIYLSGPVPPVEARIIVIDRDSTRSEVLLKSPEYYYPHTITQFKTAKLGEIMAAEKAAIDAGKTADKISGRFKKLHGIYETWNADDIVNRATTLRPDLDEELAGQAKSFGVQVYAFMAYSVDFWDTFNNNILGLRGSRRILRGGLQLAANGMPQGDLLVIPLTRSIGLQNQTHVIVHITGADPDMGRKGFQPDLVRLANLLATAAVTSLKHRKESHLMPSPGAPTVVVDKKWRDWVAEQEAHERDFPLVLDPQVMSRAPRIAISSVPQCEQDVIALFNELLSAGVLRGYRILTTSQRETYDGLFKVSFDTEADCLFDPVETPLGLTRGILPQFPWRAPTATVEYKYSIDGLIEDFDNEDKIPRHVSLAVAWELGQSWKRDWGAVSLLDPDNQGRREYYGATHLLTSQNGAISIHLIILRDIFDFMRDPTATVQRHQAELAAL
jgi:hypothetical protein